MLPTSNQQTCEDSLFCLQHWLFYGCKYDDQIQDGFLKKIVFIYLRERTCTHKCTRGGWGLDREGEGQADSSLSMEPDVGLHPMNWDHDLSWKSRVRLSTDWATQAAPNPNWFKPKRKTQRILLLEEPLGTVWSEFQPSFSAVLCLPSLHFQAALPWGWTMTLPRYFSLRTQKYINTKFPGEVIRFSLIIT